MDLSGMIILHWEETTWVWGEGEKCSNIKPGTTVTGVDRCSVVLEQWIFYFCSLLCPQVWGFLERRKGRRVRQTRGYTTAHFLGVIAMLFPLHCFGLGCRRDRVVKNNYEKKEAETRKKKMPRAAANLKRWVSSKWIISYTVIWYLL